MNNFVGYPETLVIYIDNFVVSLILFKWVDIEMCVGGLIFCSIVDLKIFVVG